MVPSDFAKQITTVYCDDIVAAEAFYKQRMGLPLVRVERSLETTRMLFQVSENGLLGISDRRGRPRGVPGVCFTFLCANVDDEYVRLRARGVVFRTPPRYNVAGAGGEGEHKSGARRFMRACRVQRQTHPVPM